MCSTTRPIGRTISRCTARKSIAAVASDTISEVVRIRRPWSIIAARSGHSCSVTSISLFAPCRVRPMTRMIRSWSAAKTRSASRISVIWSVSRKSKVSCTSSGIGLSSTSSRTSSRRSTTFSTSAVARSSLLRSGVTPSSAASRAAPAPRAAPSRGGSAGSPRETGLPTARRSSTSAIITKRIIKPRKRPERVLKTMPITDHEGVRTVGGAPAPHKAPSPAPLARAAGTRSRPNRIDFPAAPS